MQIISTIPLYNYKVPIITTTKKTSHSVLVNHGKLSKLFLGLSRTYKQNSRTFKDFPGQKKIQDFSRMWQPCCILMTCSYLVKMISAAFFIELH